MPAMNMDLNEIFQSLPKLLTMADDLNRMADYINELRLVTFLIVGTSYVGGFIFLLIKLCQWRTTDKKEAKRARYQDEEKYMTMGSHWHAANPGIASPPHYRTNGLHPPYYPPVANGNTGMIGGTYGKDSSDDGYRERPLEDISKRRLNEVTDSHASLPYNNGDAGGTLPMKDPNAGLPTNV